METNESISKHTLDIIKKQGFFDLTIPQNIIQTFKSTKEIIYNLSNLEQQDNQSSEIEDIKIMTDNLSMKILQENIILHFKSKIENIITFLPIKSYPDILEPEIQEWKKFLYDSTGENNQCFYSIFGLLQNSNNMENIYEYIKKYQNSLFSRSNHLLNNFYSAKQFLFNFKNLIEINLNNHHIKDEVKVKNLQILCSIIDKDEEVLEESKKEFFKDLIQSNFINEQKETIIFSIFDILKDKVNFQTDFKWKSLFYKSNTHKDNVINFIEPYLDYFLLNKIIEPEELNINKEYKDSPINCELRHILKFHRELKSFFLSKHEKSMIIQDIKNDDNKQKNKKRI